MRECLSQLQWKYASKFRFHFRTGSFMSRAVGGNKSSKDAGRRNQVASPPKAVCTWADFSSTYQTTPCKAPYNRTRRALFRSSGATYSASMLQTIFPSAPLLQLPAQSMRLFHIAFTKSLGCKTSQFLLHFSTNNFNHKHCETVATETCETLSFWGVCASYLWDPGGCNSVELSLLPVLDELLLEFGFALGSGNPKVILCETF